MQIVIYTRVFAPSVGGVETLMMSLAAGLSGRETGRGGKRVEVIVLTAQAAGEFDDRGLPFRVVRQPGLWGMVQWFRRADVVHLAGPSLVPLLAGLVLRRPVIVSHHGFQAACPNGQFFLQPEARLCPGHFLARRHGQCLKCNTGSGRWPSVKSWLVTFPRRWMCQCTAVNVVPTSWLGTVLKLPRTAVVAHGVAESSVVPAADPAIQPKFSFVGRLVSTKGVGALLAAAKHLKAKGHSFQLQVIGDGPEREELKANTKRAGLNGTVEFLGAVEPERIEQELAGSMAVVVPSLAGEVFGLVAAENMMAGRAVVTSDIGALREVSGDTGLSFPAGDAHALAERLESLLKTPGLAARLGEQARRRAQELFHVERMVSEHLRLYEEAMPRAGTLRSISGEGR